MFLNIIKTIIIGIIEGITEWLPISSTGHMILANEFIKLDVSSEFWKMFEVVIQLGAIMAVVVIYFKDLFPWGFNKTKEDTKNTFILWGKILMGCIPCAIVGLLFDDWIDEHFYNPWTVAITLFVNDNNHNIIYTSVSPTSVEDAEKYIDTYFNRSLSRMLNIKIEDGSKPRKHRAKHPSELKFDKKEKASAKNN